jgi:SAM-dependent methyltransferase
VEAGGGDATNAIAIARKFPNLHVTVFDSASVCTIAAKNIKKAGLADRVSTSPGDFFVDPFPKDIDSILFCHIFTIWSPAQALKLLRRSYKALRPGGKLLIFNMMGDDDDSGPVSTALGSPYFLTVATSGGFMYSWKEHESRIRKAGFRRVERISGLPLAHGVLVATK